LVHTAGELFLRLLTSIAIATISHVDFHKAAKGKAESRSG
jgi:hypothetical protein